MDRWEDISNSSIEILRVFKSLKEINNISLNGASFVDLFEIEKLNNVNLPIVQTININSGAALYVDGINSPMACRAHFDFKSVHRFLNVNIPNLLEASFKRRSERSDDIKLNQCDISCFKNTRVLNITGPFLQCLRKCNATKMVLCSTEHASESLIEFPQLDRLVIYTTGAVPRFNAPKLSQLLIRSRADQLSGFHFDYYPGLEHHLSIHLQK
jgi:hypothetical protein